MRIGVLMSVASPWSRQAAQRLSECGHKVHAIGFGKGTADSYVTLTDRFQASEIEEFRQVVAGLHILGPRHPSASELFLYARALKTMLHNMNAQMLLTLYGGTFATLAYLSGFRPYAVFAVGSDILFGSFPKRVISRFALTGASTVFSNGNYLANKARELAPGAQVQELYLGTDVEKFSIGSAFCEPVTVVCSRGFSKVYNNELILRALATIPEGANSFKIVFVAGGPLLGRARSLADEILVPSRRETTQFLGGIGRNDLASLLRNSHVYVSASKSDGTSLSLLEAMACGLFPVLSDIPQNREWISEEASNGILFPVDDPNALASALVRAVSDPELRGKAALYNRQLILEKADHRKNMATLASNLEAIVSRRQIRTEAGARGLSSDGY